MPKHAFDDSPEREPLVRPKTARGNHMFIDEVPYYRAQLDPHSPPDQQIALFGFAYIRPGPESRSVFDPDCVPSALDQGAWDNTASAGCEATQGPLSESTHKLNNDTGTYQEIALRPCKPIRRAGSFTFDDITRQQRQHLEAIAIRMLHKSRIEDWTQMNLETHMQNDASLKKLHMALLRHQDTVCPPNLIVAPATGATSLSSTPTQREQRLKSTEHRQKEERASALAQKLRLAAAADQRDAVKGQFGHRPIATSEGGEGLLPNEL